MAKIPVSKADLLAAVVIPDIRWFSFSIQKVDVEKSSKGDSFNIIVYGDIIEDEKYEGKQIRTYFNTKAPGRLVPLHSAVTGLKMDEPGDIDTDEFVGKKFDGKVGTRTMEGGGLINEIQEFLPYGEGVKSGDMPAWMK